MNLKYFDSPAPPLLLYRYDTDHETLFRQESYFQYLFGVSEAGVTGAVSLPSGAATLFVPRHGLEYEVFCGRYPKLPLEVVN